MKKLFFVLFLFYSCTNSFCQDIIRFPELKTVVDEFDNNYKFQGVPGTLNLAKTPEGWVLYELDYSDFPVIKKKNQQVFWSAKAGEFKQLNYPTGETESGTLQKIAISAAYNYERNYFYGYAGAELETIKTLEGRVLLNDTLTEALARAYSSYAMTFFSTGNYYTIETEADLLTDTSSITENHADSFVKYVDKAIETYSQLYESNPMYETKVGSSYIKYSNEYLYAYLTLYEYGFDEKASKYLVKGLYGDEFLSAIKNYFYGLDNNAILFTNGDNDTYPLIYLQQTERLRPDVHVINYSLLGRASYIKLIQQGYGNVSAVKMTLKHENYFDYKLSYLQVTSSSNMIKTPEELLSWATTKKANERNIDLFEKTLRFKVNKTNCARNNLIANNEQADDFITVHPRNVIYKNNIAAWDIMYTNDWLVPVFFGQGMSSEMDNLVDKEYIRRVGMESILVPARSTEQDAIDVDRLYNNLMNKYTFKHNYMFEARNGEGFAVIRNQIVFPYVYLAQYFIGKGQNDSARRVINRGLEIIPGDYARMDFYTATFGQLLLQLGEKAEAEKLLVEICEDLYKKYLHPPREIYYERIMPRREDALYNLDVLIGIAEDNDLKELLTKAQNIKGKIE